MNSLCNSLGQLEFDSARDESMKKVWGVWQRLGYKDSNIKNA